MWIFLMAVLALYVLYKIFSLFNTIKKAIEPKRKTIKTAKGNDLVIKKVEAEEDFVPYNAFPLNVEREGYHIENFNVIDFETANMYPDSICQIGITLVRDNKIENTLAFLVRPPYDDFRNTGIHGIHLFNVQNEPTFAELWPEIKQYFEGQTLAAYNMSFDFGCLEASLSNFDIPSPDYCAFDILHSSRRYIKGIKNHSLKSVTSYLHIDSGKAHDAGADSAAAASVQIQINSIKNSFCDVVLKYSDTEKLQEAKRSLSNISKEYLKQNKK